MTIQIAWRNVWRNKLRSAIVIVAVTLGLIGGIIADALMNGMSMQRVESAINNELGDIQIHHPKFLENNEEQYTISDAQKIIKELDTTKNVKGYSPRFKIVGMASTSASGQGVSILGVDPEMEIKTTKLVEKLDSGSTFLKKKRGTPIVIGGKLAEKLKVKMRKKVILTFQDKDGNLVGGSFRIIGIYRTNNSLFDERTVFVKRKDLARLSGYSTQATNEIAIRLKKHKEVKTEYQKLKSQYTTLSVQSWRELAPELAMMNDFMNQMMYAFLLVILLALGFGIVNTMLMVVLERVKELGMLMAIGMNKWRVFSMIMYETVMLSVTGGILGMLISSGIINFWSKKGLHLSAVSKGLESIGFSPVIYPQIGTDFYVGLTILVIITGILASIYPARKAIKLDPADAIRTE